jgi:hypothetical protein
MVPASRTPEGEPNRCPVCGKQVRIEPSRPPGDAPCPHCGHLLWFSDPQSDARLVNHTKQQIRLLVQEITQLSKQNLAPEPYFEEFLPRVVAALAAIGGVVWMKKDAGQLALQYHVNLRRSRLAERSEEDQVRHGRLLQQVMATGEGLLVPPHSSASENVQAGNPTDWLLVLGPLKADQESVGIVEVFQRTEAGPAIQRGYLRFLIEMCELASRSVALRRCKST